jgi:hypothetical protein
MVADMTLLGRKRLLRLVLMAYTAISVLGAFSFAAAEPFHAVEIEMADKAQDTISGLAGNLFPQHPAEEAAISAKAGGVRSSPARTDFQHAASLSGLPASGKHYPKLTCASETKTHCAGVKSIILLKLRI